MDTRKVYPDVDPNLGAFGRSAPGSGRGPTAGFAESVHTITRPASGSPARTLRPELGVYDANRETLLRDHPGEWVVIYGDELLGTYPTEEAAVDAGYGRYGLVSFLCRQITAEPDPVVHYAHELP
jgi:hypothetical protein